MGRAKGLLRCCARVGTPGMSAILATASLLPFVGGSLYFHLRGRRRFKLRRQLGDYSTLLAPYNAWACLVAAGGNRPLHDGGDFPELGLLREHWREIRDEAQALLAEGRVTKTEKEDDVVFHSFMKRDWKRCYLKWYRDFLPSARERCPRTVALLSQIGCVNGAMFAVLGPHGKLGKHRDPFAGTLRYRLGLSTPNSPDCHSKRRVTPTISVRQQPSVEAVYGATIRRRISSRLALT